MADVQPFRGLRYDVQRVGGLSPVISPPYDVISPREQQLYLRHSPYNVIRLELGEEQPSDSPEDNQYTRAAGTLKKWLEEGILFREQRPALYIFEHRFIHQGVQKSRWGLNARVRVEDWSTGWVRPHEHTFQEKIGDRLKLMRSCCCNLSPIMGMFRQEPGGLFSFLTRLAKDKPDLSALDLQGVTHNVWIIHDEKSIAGISAWCADKVIYIADGHHRYETALAYKREQIAAHSPVTGDESFNFVMMTLMDAGDPGVIMFPTHRLVRQVEPESLARLKEELSPFFHLEELNPSGATPAETLKVWLDVLEERGGKGLAIGLYGLDGKRFCILMPREESNLQDMMPPDRSQSWKDLDVAILHQIILRRIMGMDALREEACLKHTQEGMEAINLVDSGEYQLAFLMNPVPVSSVLAVADTGDRMPQKFTYFYPKLPTGFAIYPLWDNEP
ncbi:DUF1015 domain-containing protein [Chloroflexota bacterium]